MSNPAQESCKFFVQRKKRYCKMLIKPGQEFCGEHQKISDIQDINNDSLSTSSIRIVCPLDKKHTVYASKLEKHLKICNGRPTDAQPYIQRGVNTGKSEVLPSKIDSESFQILSSFPRNEVLSLLDKINAIYEKNVIISDKRLSFLPVEEEMQKPEYGSKTKKHLKQASAIIGLLQEYKMIKENSCFIEFGAGRGQLSCWIAEATKAMNNSKILLIERASPKHKRDNKLARTLDGIQRIKVDIGDLVLDKLDVVNKVENIIGITKHLCGEAIDLSLRCLTGPKINIHKVNGAILTVCCHHRCRWTPYTGKTFFEENHLDVNDFNIMCGLTSWATCGMGYSREYRQKMSSEGRHDSLKIQKDPDYELTRAEREEIGRRCKNIINWGRLKYLEEHNFQCSLHHYVSKDITLENVCIVAIKQGNR